VHWKSGTEEILDFRRAVLRRADLLWAHLDGANLGGARGLTQKQINEAYGDAKTQLPDGLTRPARWAAPAGGGASKP